MKKLTHGALINLVRVFAPDISEGGVCNGTTAMWAQAVLISESEEISFYSRLDTLSAYLSHAKDEKETLQLLQKEIDSIYESHKPSATSSQEEKKWTEEQLSKVEMRAFSEDVALQQSPRILKMNVSQLDQNVLFPLTASKALDRSADLCLLSDFPEMKDLGKKIYIAQEGNRLKYILLNLKGEKMEGFLNPEDFADLPKDAFTKFTTEGLTKGSLHKLTPNILDSLSEQGHILKITSDIVGTVGFTPMELVKYLDEIKEILKKDHADKKSLLNKSGVFLLGSDEHTVGMYFHFPSGKWHFFDVNKLSDKEEYYFTEESGNLAPIIFDAFTDKKNTVFSVRYLSAYPNPSLVHSLKAVTYNLLPKSPDSIAEKINDRGYNTLLLAAKEGDTRSVTALLEAGAHVDIQSKGKTALSYAVLFGDVHMVKVLLNAHANPNIKNATTGYTPLMLAITSDCNKSEKIDMVKALLKAGANINITNTSGDTAMKFARFSKNVSSGIFELLQDPKWASQDALAISSLDWMDLKNIKQIAAVSLNSSKRIIENPRLMPFIVAHIRDHIKANNLTSNDMNIINKIPAIQQEVTPLLIDTIINHPDPIHLNIANQIPDIFPALSEVIISKVTDPKTNPKLEQLVIQHLLTDNNIQDQIVRKLTRHHPLTPQDKSAIDVFMSKSPSIKDKLTVALFENATPKERESLLQDNTLSEFLKKKFIERIETSIITFVFGVPYGCYQPGDDEIIQKYAKEFADIVISSPSTQLARVLSSDKRIDETLKAREKREIEHPPETQEDQQSPVVRIVTRANPSEPTKTLPSSPSRLKKT